MVQKVKGWKKKMNASKKINKTPIKTSNKPLQKSKVKSNPSTTKNPYTILDVLEGINREKI